MPPSVVRGLATGQVWMAPAALVLGLIDKVMPKDDDGKMPLDYAESSGMIRLLKEHGAVEIP